jgi:hypothetical protein
MAALPAFSVIALPFPVEQKARLFKPFSSQKRAAGKGRITFGDRSFSLTLHTGQARSVTRVLLIFVGVFIAAAIDDSSLQ